MVRVAFSFLGLSLALFVAPATAKGPPVRGRPSSRDKSTIAKSIQKIGPAPIAAPDPPIAPPASAPSAVFVDGKRCVEQAAQPFLIRGNWFAKGTADDVRRGQSLFQDAVRYRTEKYGYFGGFGKPEWNAHSPQHFAQATTFMGLPLTVHQRIVPALKCVEAALRAGPAHMMYHPHGVGGFRAANTYHGGEVSNHVYGIAIDIDSEENTCCGCVAPWNGHPLCRKKVDSIYERMTMPQAWVATFERFGFYWLGHDVLQDTMHFEFLGDPDKVFATPFAKN